MDMTGERRIPASPEAVWAALNDPAILRAAIPGCESLEKESETAMKATVVVKVGPISAKFTGKVQLLDLDPPKFCRIAGEGQGGVAGFAKGGATVTLQAEGAGPLLTYDVQAQVGAKMAQLGARLIDASARQTADAFFTRFAELVAAPASEVVPAAPPAIGLFDIIPRAPFGYPLIGWVGAVLCLAVLILLFGSSL